MTEEEAETKVCPQTFGIPDVRDHEGNGLVQGGPRNCIASACMAWRGKETVGFATKAEAEFRRFGRRIEPTGSDTEGYCGLAGKPQ